MPKPNTDSKEKETDILVREDVLPGSSVRIVESKDEDGKKEQTLEITLIESGWSKNGFYYSDEVAESVATHAKERKKMYIDHSDPWLGGPSRSLKDWAATIVETWTENGKAIAKAEMTTNPETQWLYQEALKDPANVGASIDAMVKIKPYEPEEGEELTAEEKQSRRYIVEEVRFLNSTDFVTYASAGGVVNKVLASFNHPGAFQDKFMNVFKELNVQLEQLNKLTGGQSNTNNNNNQTNRKESHMADENTKAKPTLTLESFKSDYPEIFDSVREEIRAAVETELKTAAETDKEIKQLKDQVKTLESEKVTLVEEKDTLKVKVDEFETKEAAQAKRKKVNTLIKEAELSDEYVSDIFVQDLMRLDKDEDIKTRIEERVKLVNNVDAGVTGNGQRPTQESEGNQVAVSDDELIASLKG